MLWENMTTFEDVQSLPVQIVAVPRRVVDVPEPAKVMDLRGPYVTASRCSARRVNHLLRGCLEAIYCRRSCYLDVIPGRRQQVVVSTSVHL